MEITKKQFEGYETVRQSGVTNMFDVQAVIKYAKRFCNVKLNKDIIVEIMHQYSQLKEMYGG